MLRGAAAEAEELLPCRAGAMYSNGTSTRAASLLPFPTRWTIAATAAGSGGASVVGGNAASTGSFGVNFPSFHASV